MLFVIARIYFNSLHLLQIRSVSCSSR